MAFGAICAYNNDETFYRNVLMPAMHKVLSPEASQTLGLYAAKWALIPKSKFKDSDILKTKVFGLEFSNPIGIAAGLDKNADAPSGLFRSGIGFLEVGTVTPLPQEGNPKPRIFRLSEDGGIINRCGFNSKGHNHVRIRLEACDRRGVLGVNLGKNKFTESDEDDYILGIKAFSWVADYFAINISSPNTPGLRSLQKKDRLEKLLDKILEARDQNFHKLPILLKISPDLTYDEKKDIAKVVTRKGKMIDGLIITNTTINRPDTIKSENKKESGGLSGKPLKDISTNAIKEMYRLTQGKIPIVGVGGVSSGADAYEKIKAGASLIQLYTAMTYEGPPVIEKIKRELQELLIADNYSRVAEAVGTEK